MYGWRARIGLILPSSNTTMEPEMRRLLPEGVTLHSARVPLRSVTVEELVEMEEAAEEEARRLATLEPDLLVYGCTTGSLVKGPGHDEAVARRLSRAAGGVPAIATATAVVEAARALAAERIALLSPYIREVHEREISFLEHHGLRVAAERSLGIRENIEIGRVDPRRLYREARRLVEGSRSSVDVLFISCTNLPTLEIIEPLERDLGIPVYSSNTATAWLALSRLGVREAATPAGRLLRLLQPNP